MRWLDHAAVVPDGASWPLLGDPAPTDFVSVSQVEETKQLARLMPVWLSLLVWNLCYAQLATVMVQQAEGMDRQVGQGGVGWFRVVGVVGEVGGVRVRRGRRDVGPCSAGRRAQPRTGPGHPAPTPPLPHPAHTTLTSQLGSFAIPSASILIFATLTILCLVPLWDRVVHPALDRRGWAPTSLQRSGASHFFMALSMTAAAVVEAASESLRSTGIKGISYMEHDPATVSVFWLIPQIVLLGFAEFFFIGIIEFFYQQAPERMRSLAAALELVSFGIASFISSGLISTISHHTQWLPGNGPHGTGMLE